MSFSEPNIDSLIARVEKLESQNHRWKMGADILALLSASLVLVGAKLADRMDTEVLRARTVEAQDFVLKDAEGRVYARLGMHLNKLENNGGVSVVVPGPSGPSLQFYGDNGKTIWTAPQEPKVIPATR